MLDNLFKYKATHVLMDIIIGMLCHYIFYPVWLHSSPWRYLFPRVILNTFFSFLLIYGGEGFWGWSFQLMGFGPCGMGHPGFFWGWGFLYQHRRITPEKNFSYMTLMCAPISQYIIQTQNFFIIIWPLVCYKKTASKKINNKFICIVTVKLLTPIKPKNSNPVWEILGYTIYMRCVFNAS